MEISKPTITINSDKIEYRVSVNSLQGHKILWYRLDKRYGDLISDFSDAALVALLLPAMARAEDINIKGRISERLYYNLSGPCQSLIKLIIPSLSLVKIFPDDVLPHVKKGKGVATGFSGGIDSFCALADHFYSDVPSDYKITHLLYNNVGSHGWGGEKLFRERFDHLKPLSESLGLPFISTDSNLESFYGGKDALNFVATVTIRNASVALLFQNGIKNFLYASSVPYQNICVKPDGILYKSDPILLPLFNTDVLDLISTGCEYTRVQKTMRVNEIADSYDMLDVCVDSNPGKPWNCSKCFKCLRTLITLDIAGVLENYSKSFDIDTYLQYRNNYIKEILQSDDVYSKEIVQFAEQRNYILK